MRIKDFHEILEIAENQGFPTRKEGQFLGIEQGLASENEFNLKKSASQEFLDAKRGPF